jgi:uncharacterized protein
LRRSLRAGLAAAALALALACKGAASPAPSAAPPPEPPPQPSTNVVFPDGWTVQVDLALTPEQQAQGLMFVKYLPPDHGMLFLFAEDGPRSFWMKNCLISLDLVWLDENDRVVDISRDVPPCEKDPCPNYSPSRPVRNVLEVQGGLCAAHKLAIGDKLVVVGLPAGARP